MSEDKTLCYYMCINRQNVVFHDGGWLVELYYPRDISIN